MLDIYARMAAAREDVSRLKQIIKKLPRDIKMNKFSERMCSICPHMCDDCDFCFMLFKFVSTSCYERILERMVHAFYHGIDVSSFTFFIYSICPICEMNCKTVYSDNDCPYDYLKQMGNHRPMFGDKPVSNNKTIEPRTSCQGRLFSRPKNLHQSVKSSKPCVIITGDTMSKIVSKIWRLDETDSQAWIDCS